MAEAEVTPAELRFRFQLNKQTLATINLNNPYDKRMAFKIKTTAPKKYVVRPSSGVCEPKSSVSVQVIMQAQKEYPSDFTNCKDKFMVQTTLMEDDEQIDKDTFAKELRADGDKTLKEHRLRVVLEGPAAPPSPVPEADENGEDSRGQVDIPDVRLRNNIPELSNIPSDVASLKAALEKANREKEDYKRQLDSLQYSQGTKAATKAAPAAAATASKFNISIIQIILVAVIAFLIGHFT